MHSEGRADLQNSGADRLVGWPRTSIEECPAGEIRRGQRAHRWRTRHVEVLGLGDDVRERPHLLQSRELFRHDRHLVLGVDVRGVSRMEAVKLFPAHDCLLQLLRDGVAGDYVLDVYDLPLPMQLHLGNDLLGDRPAAQCLVGLRLVHVSCSVAIALAGASNSCGTTEHWRMRMSLAVPACFVAMASTSARACDAIPRVWA